MLYRSYIGVRRSYITKERMEHKNNKLVYHIVEFLVLKGFSDYRENDNINKRKSSR